MLRKGLKHKGFAFIEIFQACPTYNRETPDHWFAQRIKDIDDLKKYDKSDIWQARKIVQDLENEIYIGHIYEDKIRKSFEELQANRKLNKRILRDEVKHYDITKLI
jgi:2-oxoglutarate ferredoxin oxidoreductase subunit beta